MTNSSPINQLKAYCRICTYLSCIKRVVMQTVAEPQLLSLLQKCSHPLEEIKATVILKGVFAPPEQWKITDEANPNIFTYSITVLGHCFKSGKIEPRKMTEKEIKQMEEAKSKKGAKKQTKQQEKQPEETQQAIQAKLEWQALSQTDRFYKTSEDPYKMFYVLFPQNSTEITFKGDQLTELYSQLDQGSFQIKLSRKPALNEEQIGKLKKSKPKSLNLGQLYEALYKGIVDITPFAIPGEVELIARIPLDLVEQVPPECTKIAAQKCYAHVKVLLDTALTPKVEEIRPEVADILPTFKSPFSRKHMNMVQKLKAEIVRAIKAISQEYSSYFIKDKDEDRKRNSFGGDSLRRNQINKKKQQFLTEFVNSGKYFQLKKRIGQTIKAIYVNKFRLEKQSKPISQETLNQTLSELYTFFTKFLHLTLEKFFLSQKTSIHQDIASDYFFLYNARQAAMSIVMDQSTEERQKRLAYQYELIGQTSKAQQNYLNLIAMNKYDVISLEAYAKFCLKNKKFDEAFILYKRILSQLQEKEKRKSLECKFTIAVLLIVRRRSKQAVQLLTIMVQDESAEVQDKIIYTSLISFIYQLGADVKRSEKYLAFTEKYYQLQQNPYFKLNPAPNPYIEPTPKIPKPTKYTSILTEEELQQIKLSLLTALAEKYCYGLVEAYLPHIQQTDFKKKMQIKCAQFRGSFKQALTIIEELLASQPFSVELLLIKADLCFKADKPFECQQTFLSILNQKPAESLHFQLYLRLAYTYLNRKSYEDSKQIFLKTVELKSNSALAWLGLGVSCLKLKEYRQAEEALNLVKVYNQMSKEVQEHIKQIQEWEDSQKVSEYKYLRV